MEWRWDNETGFLFRYLRKAVGLAMGVGFGVGVWKLNFIFLSNSEFTKTARSANAPVGIVDPTPAEEDLGVPGGREKPTVTESRYKFEFLC